MRLTADGHEHGRLDEIDKTRYVFRRSDGADAVRRPPPLYIVVWPADACAGTVNAGEQRRRRLRQRHVQPRIFDGTHPWTEKSRSLHDL